MSCSNGLGRPRRVSASVRTNAEARRVVLGLGSNRGNRRGILLAAFESLDCLLADLRASSFYESDPMYVLDQAPFINAAVSGLFSGSPQDLLSAVQAVEADYGRDRSVERRRGERTLDIDILLFGDLVVDQGPELQIPHPCLLERKFALLPLLELHPEALDPRDGHLLAQTYADLGTQGIYYADTADYNHPNGNERHGGGPQFPPEGI